jgi:hypothetical protein
LSVWLQECTWLYAYEDPAVSRNWKIHFRSIQQAIWQYSRHDSPLHSEQIANPWCRTHVSPASSHWAVALATAFLLHHSKAVSEWVSMCTVLWWHVITKFQLCCQEETTYPYELPTHDMRLSLCHRKSCLQLFTSAFLHHL